MIRPVTSLLLPVILAVALAFAVGAPKAKAQAPIDVLSDALGVSELVGILRDEGIAYGDDLREEMFPGGGKARWSAMLDQIYDTDRMEATLRQRLDRELAAEETAPMIDFFESELGRRIVQLEVTARRAMMDDAVDEAARDALRDMRQKADPRLKLIETFVEANDLIELNVMGALNSNYAFYSGLVDGGAFEGQLTEDMILADVWSQEESIRKDTAEWLHAYLTMAYGPLSAGEIEAYTEFSRTEAGRKLNAAIFAAFDELFVAQSLALGRGAASFMAGEEL